MKYAVHPDYVVSRNDADVHHIDANSLIRLYGVDPRECVVIDKEKTNARTYAHLMRCADEDGLIHLRPRFDGNYVTPEPKAPPHSVNPWVPMTNLLDLKHLGKLGEETGELSSAVARCIIQGIDGAEPVTGKINREWLEDEIADVKNNIELVTEHFGLDWKRIEARVEKKRALLKIWHGMLEGL